MSDTEAPVDPPEDDDGPHPEPQRIDTGGAPPPPPPPPG